MLFYATTLLYSCRSSDIASFFFLQMVHYNRSLEVPSPPELVNNFNSAASILSYLSLSHVVLSCSWCHHHVTDLSHKLSVTDGSDILKGWCRVLLGILAPKCMLLLLLLLSLLDVGWLCCWYCSCCSLKPERCITRKACQQSVVNLTWWLEVLSQDYSDNTKLNCHPWFSLDAKLNHQSQLSYWFAFSYCVISWTTATLDQIRGTNHLWSF